MARRKKGEKFIFTVEGRGEFPFDMLRYDCCFPLAERYDSGALMIHHTNDAYFKARRVALATYFEGSPTPARWESFGWRYIGEGELRFSPPMEKQLNQASQPDWKEIAIENGWAERSDGSWHKPDDPEKGTYPSAQEVCAMEKIAYKPVRT